MRPLDILVTDYKGFRDDRGPKFIGENYFFSVENFNYDSFIGADKIKERTQVNTVEYVAGKSIDGIYEYTFVDSSNNPQKLEIFVTGGRIYKGFVAATLIDSSLLVGKCTFAVQNGKLVICNGKNYPKILDNDIVYEMGAPRAEDSGIGGNPNGTYYYAQTYITAGGEEVLGSVSNTLTVVTNQINLKIPIGYAGTLTRKIYRTVNGGSQLKLLVAIGNNTDETYVDNIADGGLGVDIPAINNEMPKPYFIETQFNKLVGAITDMNPTQIYVTDAFNEVFDSAAFTTTEGVVNDNTPLVGMKADYGILIVGSQKTIFTVDVSGSSTIVKATRANVGIKNGYTMVSLPSDLNFGGGVMFASTLNDVRLFSGNLALPVATSFENLKTENFGQPIKNTLNNLIRSGVSMTGAFFDYKYHLSIDNVILVFDTRFQNWWKYVNQNSYVFGLVNQKLYSGQKNASFIELMYNSVTYKGQSVTATLTSADLAAGEDVKYFSEIHFFFVNGSGAKIDVQAVVEDNINQPITGSFNLTGGVYDPNFYDPQFYESGESGEDYKVLHVNQFGRWIQFKITVTEGIFLFRGARLVGQYSLNKEKV